MSSDSTIDAIASAIFGLKPFDVKRDVPQDVGLGGPSTEYLAGSQDPRGNEFNYPQIWWVNGKPALLSPDAAYDQALKYETATGMYFPRYRNSGAADMFARSRSEMGGASLGPLATFDPTRNY